MLSDTIVVVLVARFLQRLCKVIYIYINTLYIFKHLHCIFITTLTLQKDRLPVTQKANENQWRGAYRVYMALGHCSESV